MSYSYILFYSKIHESSLNSKDLQFVTVNNDVDKLFDIMILHEMSLYNDVHGDVNVVKSWKKEIVEYYENEKSKLTFREYSSPITGMNSKIKWSDFITCRGESSENYQIIRHKI